MPCIFLTSANKKNLFSFKTRPGHDVFCKDTETFFFLSALSLRRTSKDQHFHPCIETKLPQNLDKNIPPKEFKKILQKDPPKKILQTNPPKKILLKKFSKKST